MAYSPRVIGSCSQSFYKVNRKIKSRTGDKWSRERGLRIKNNLFILCHRVEWKDKRACKIHTQAQYSQAAFPSRRVSSSSLLRLFGVEIPHSRLFVIIGSYPLLVLNEFKELQSFRYNQAFNNILPFHGKLYSRTGKLAFALAVQQTLKFENIPFDSDLLS